MRCTIYCFWTYTTWKKQNNKRTLSEKKNVIKTNLTRGDCICNFFSANVAFVSISFFCLCKFFRLVNYLKYTVQIRMLPACGHSPDRVTDRSQVIHVSNVASSESCVMRCWLIMHGADRLDSSCDMLRVDSDQNSHSRIRFFNNSNIIMSIMHVM